MRKLVSISVIFALLVSVFDIIDVSDITLNGKEIFTTDNAYADQDNDGLDDYAFHLSGGLIFNLPSVMTHFSLFVPETYPLPAADKAVPIRLISSLYRPLII